MDLLEKIPRLRMDRSRHAAPQLFDALRELITSLELVPGTVLSRAELADHYGVSQTPIRDALMKLNEEGLVDIFAQHATVVSRIDIAGALQAHFLRRSIELEIINTVVAGDAGALKALVKRLRAHITRQTQALAPRDYADFTAADRDFHRELYAAADMGDLWLLVRRRSGHVDRLRRLNLPAKGKAQAVVKDHTAIVDALDKRKAEQACNALRAHLSGTLAFVDEVRTKYPGYVTG